MRKELSLGILLLSGSIPVLAAEWVDLDRVGDKSYLLRQGDRQSLRRTGPWAEFTQRWLSYRDGVLLKQPPTTEVMAVNCLTGAHSAKTYESTDPDTDERKLITNSFADIEQGTSPITRIDITKPRKGLDANLIDFACGCKSPKANVPVDDGALVRIYDAFIKEQTKEVGYRMRYMRFDTIEEANSALKMVEAGASFASVAQRLNPQPEFPGGDLGTHPSHAWGPHAQQLFRELKPGEYTRRPSKGVYGYEIQFMESRYEKPAAPLSTWRAAIERYARREQSCGRTLFQK